MQTACEATPQTWAFLEYAYATAIALFCLVAPFLGVCSSQTAAVLSSRKKRFVVACMLVVASSCVLETLLGVYGRPAEPVPQSSRFRAASVALVWTILAVHLCRARALLWSPYVGVFVLGFLFDSLTTGSLLANARYCDATTLCLNTIRLVTTLVLSADRALLILPCCVEQPIDEEAQPLLGHADVDAAQPRRTHPAEPDNWIEYLQGFAVFIPHLLPWRDPKIACSLATRVVVAILKRGFNVATPRQLGIAIDRLGSGSGTMPWKELSLWACYLWLNSSAGFEILDSLATNHIDNTSYKQIKELAIDHIMGLSLDFHSQKDTGEVLKAIYQAGSLTNLVQLVVFQVVPIMLDLVIAMVYVTHLFDIYLMLVIFGISAIYMSLAMVLSPWIQRKQRMMTEDSRTESTTEYDIVSNWRTVAHFDRNEFEKQRYVGVVQDFIDASYGYLYRILCSNAAQDLIMTAGFAGCTSLAAAQVATGKKSIGSLITFVTYWSAIKGTVKRLANSYRTINSTLIDAERLLRLLYTEPSVKNAEAAKELAVDNGEIRFEGVSFAYDPDKPIIEKLDLVVGAGKSVGIVGRSGSGKSTLFHLLLRLYDTHEGSITIDGHDLSEFTISSLRSAIGIVGQDSRLFNRSISEIVSYGRLDASAEEVAHACRAAAIHERIMELPDRYQTRVGEEGAQLSGGERQRLTIARVLVRNPRIVLLDEATSAIDTLTETEIQKAFQSLRSGRTMLVIAHRLSTVVECDEILVMEGGKIVESGTHRELLAKKGMYKELWDQQNFR